MLQINHIQEHTSLFRPPQTLNQGFDEGRQDEPPDLDFDGDLVTVTLALLDI